MEMVFMLYSRKAPESAIRTGENSICMPHQGGGMDFARPTIHAFF